MTQRTEHRTEVASLKVANSLLALINDEVLPSTHIDPDTFWQGMADLVATFGPRNQALLDHRDALQNQLDEWHREHGASFDSRTYQEFLESIGYLVPPAKDVAISPLKVDPEIATIAGPQLVVPVMNARYSLNAANARWGSLYDALYGTDVIPSDDGCEPQGQYNPKRGAKVVEWAANFLDEVLPLQQGKHNQVSSIAIDDDAITFTLSSGETTTLKEPDQWLGYAGMPTDFSSLLFKHNNLHMEMQFDPTHPVGQAHPAGLKDVVMESAVTTIQDCEDSVAAVDAQDKVAVYRNWLGLCRGTLSETFEKNGQSITRTLNEDRTWTRLSGKPITLPGRALLLVRNVGHLMRNDAILDANDQPVFEGLMDALITSTIAMHDLMGKSELQNSRTGSVYIVKPKMHGPDEVSFTVDLFAAVENILRLEANTLKIGIMDEERRTTVNLAACIERAKERVIFINTGFLDRTGDEIHSIMEAGPVVPKSQMKQQTWINAYENWNVDMGLACGLKGRAQIGKGMWAMPDLMAEMVANKHTHPEAGANCAWVPSPTAATLHAIHYHRVDVMAVQSTLAERQHASLKDILNPPLLGDTQLDPELIQRELDNNAQGILGYVVRWINHGVGCSKVPNIDDVGLMEDRATLRISSQHMANWLYHGLVSESQVMNTMQRMADVVDQQNASDPSYQPMAPHFESSIAFQAACDLVFRGRQQPNGYTEPVLHARRIEYKQSH